MESLGRLAWRELAERLTDMILSGELKPGHRLVETEIADQFNISRGPVRTALMHLGGRGLVEVRAPRGIFVVTLTGRDVQELYAVRMALEEAAIREVAGRPDLDESWPEIERHLEYLDAAAADREFEAVTSREDLAFHRSLVELSGNRRLLSFWDELAGQILLIMGTLQNKDIPEIWPLLHDHRRIHDALRSEDPLRGVARLHDHLIRTRDFMIVVVERESK